jgi:hypothetical protein
MDYFFLVSIILNSLIIIISLYLFFLFIKSSAFHTYPCYNIIIFSFIILIDNILRIIPFDVKAINYFQAFSLGFLDKLILATLSIQVFIFYLGVIETKFYYKYEKSIFFITLILNIVICSTLALIYILLSDPPIRKPNNRKYYYCGNYSNKTMIDTIFNSVYLALSFYCSVVLLFFISKKKSQATKGDIEDLDYHHSFVRALILFFLIILAFLESFFIIYDVTKGLVTEIVYLSICFIIDLFNSYNKTILKESMRIFCKKTDENVGNSMKIGADDDEDDDIEKVRTESF